MRSSHYYLAGCSLRTGSYIILEEEMSDISILQRRPIDKK